MCVCKYLYICVNLRVWVHNRFYKHLYRVQNIINSLQLQIYTLVSDAIWPRRRLRGKATHFDLTVDKWKNSIRNLVLWLSIVFVCSLLLFCIPRTPVRIGYMPELKLIFAHQRFGETVSWIQRRARHTGSKICKA